MAAVCFAAARLALALAIPPGFATGLSPAAGVALAALLLGGNRLWPGTWAGIFAAYLSAGAPVGAAALIAAGSAIQALAGAFLIRRHVGPQARLRRTVDIVKFVAIAALVAAIAPTFGLLPLYAVQDLRGLALFWDWWIWWQGEATGMILVAPLGLAWVHSPHLRWNRERVFEALAFVLLLGLACRLVFGDHVLPAYATTFLIVPFVVWVALRFTPREVTTVLAAVSAVAFWYTVQRAPAGRPQEEALLVLLLFVCTIAFTGLVLSTVRSQLEEALVQLRNRQRQLELRVSERTRELEHANRRLHQDIASRARTERLLADSERRFRLMVDSVVDYAIIMLDADGRVASWNAGAQRISGYGADEIMAQHFSRFYPAEDVARRKPQWELEIATAEGRFEEEGWRVRKDGSTYWANVVITSMRDEGGALLGFAKVVRDLTERNRVEAELIRAKVAAEKASEAKSQFLANMSHELRTPLNSLLILARLLADNPDGNLTPKQLQFAQTIHSSGMDLLSLINDLLDLAKIESGAITHLDMAPASIEEVRDDMERTFRQVAIDKGLQFSIAVDPKLPPTFRTDLARLKQVLKNLLANAFKFTGEGGVLLHIAPREPGRIAFSVRDTGIGIAPDKQKIIFEAFRQADGSTSRQYGGTGLGLSISRELTRLLGGEIEVQSEPGKGSTFTLVLPLSGDVSALAA